MSQSRPKKKPRVKIKLHSNETIVNQIAFQALRMSGSVEELRDFLIKTDRCRDIDQLLRLILERYDVEVVDD